MPVLQCNARRCKSGLHAVPRHAQGIKCIYKQQLDMRLQLVDGGLTFAALANERHMGFGSSALNALTGQIC